MLDICWLLSEGIPGTQAGEGLEPTKPSMSEHLSGPRLAPRCLDRETEALPYCVLSRASLPLSLPVVEQPPPLSTRHKM